MVEVLLSGLVLGLVCVTITGLLTSSFIQLAIFNKTAQNLSTNQLKNREEQNVAP